MKRKFYFVLFGFALIIGLWTINRDIRYYYDSYSMNFELSTLPEANGTFFLTPQMTLPKGDYEAVIDAAADKRGNGYFVTIDKIKQIEDEFLAGPSKEKILFKITKPSSHVRIGVTHNIANEYLRVAEVTIISRNAFSKVNIVRNIVESLFFALIFALIGFRLFFPESYCKKAKKFSSPVNERIFIYLLLISVMTSFTFFWDKDYLRPDDFHFHLSRIEGMKDCLINGIFPVRINPFFLSGYGYATGIYYPNVWIIPAAIIRALGFDTLTSYKLFSIFANMLSIFAAYMVTLKISRSRYGGLVAATLYAFAAYRLTDFLLRSVPGEGLSFLFTPIIIWGLYELFTGDTRKWYIFACGMLGLFYAHLLSFVIVIPFIACFFLIKIKTIISNKQVIFGIFYSVIFVILLSAYFWIPLLEQNINNQLRSNFLISTAMGFSAPNKSLLLGSHPFSPSTFWRPLPSPNLGLPLILVALSLLIITRKRATPLIKTAVFLILMGCAATFVSTDWFPWNAAAWLGNRLQFAWRILLVAVPLLSIGGGILYASIIPQNFKLPWLAILFIVCAITGGEQITQIIQSRMSIGDYPLHIESIRVCGGEYLTTNADPEFMDKNQNTILSDSPNFTTSNEDRRPLEFSFDFSATDAQEPILIEIPLLYYYGYQVEVIPADHGQTPFTVNPFLGKHGLISIRIQNVSEGKIRAYYAKTPMQKLGDLISGASALLLLLYMAINKTRERKARFVPISQ